MENKINRNKIEIVAFGVSTECPFRWLTRGVCGIVVTYNVLDEMATCTKFPCDSSL